MKGQSPVARRPAREDYEDARHQIKRVLRMHKVSAAVSLGAMATVAVISAGGLFAVVLNKLTASTSITDDPMLVAVCGGGWLFCLHFLWRSYRNGLEDVRRLLSQLIQLDEVREAFTTEIRPLRKGYESQGSHSTTDANTASDRSGKRRRKLKRNKDSMQNSHVQTNGIDNVLQFNNYKNV